MSLISPIDNPREVVLYSVFDLNTDNLEFTVLNNSGNWILRFGGIPISLKVFSILYAQTPNNLDYFKNNKFRDIKF